MMSTRPRRRTAMLALAVAMLCIGFLAAVPIPAYGYDRSPFCYDGSAAIVLAQGLRSTSPPMPGNRDLVQGSRSVEELLGCTYATNTAMEEMAEYSGMLRDAAAGKGNFGIGSATSAEADLLGEAWVGSNYTVARVR